MLDDPIYRHTFKYWSHVWTFSTQYHQEKTTATLPFSTFVMETAGAHFT